MKFEIEGMDKFMSWAAGVPDKVQKGAAESVTKRTLEMERNAKALAPVDTGHLRRSINSEIRNEGSSITGEVNTGAVEYAPYVEFGTSKQSAQPYLTPSHHTAAQGFQGDIEKLYKGLMSE